LQQEAENFQESGSTKHVQMQSEVQACLQFTVFITILLAKCSSPHLKTKISYCEALLTDCMRYAMRAGQSALVLLEHERGQPILLKAWGFLASIL